MQKERADLLLFEKGLARSRSEAQILIMSGDVKANGFTITKPSILVNADSTIEVNTNKRYVSRGAHKLIKALDSFNIDVTNKICADIGASTGGFTEVLLMRGARKVYSVDVGKGQLDFKLRKDKRVVVLEETNARYLEKSMFLEKIELATIDVSFISTDKIVPELLTLCTDDFEIIILIKPQFEVGREKVGRGGIVKNKDFVVEMVIEKNNFFQNLNLNPVGFTYSPIKGAKGNREYLLNLSLKSDKINISENIIRDVIDESWNIL